MLGFIVVCYIYIVFTNSLQGYFIRLSASDATLKNMSRYITWVQNKW